MKSVIEEGSSISKAIENGWVKAGKPKEFTVKIFQEAKKNFFGFTKIAAKVAIFFHEEVKERVHHKPRPHNNSNQNRNSNHSNRHTNNNPNRNPNRRPDSSSMSSDNSNKNSENKQIRSGDRSPNRNTNPNRHPNRHNQNFGKKSEFAKIDRRRPEAMSDGITDNDDKTNSR